MIKLLTFCNKLFSKGFLVAWLLLLPGLYNFSSAQPVYCTSGGNTSYQTSITLVSFNTIYNSSAKPSGYSDYTSIVTAVVKGTSHSLTVNLNTDGNYRVWARAWIDWNIDGDFDDAGESFDLGNARNTSNGPTNDSPLIITIPAGAVSGNTRMRISAKYNQYPTSCETGFDGEVEDYTLSVQAPLTVFYSRGSDPTQLSSWNSVRTGGGSTPSGFTADNQKFVVQPSYSMTAASPWSVSGSNTTVQVENGAVLTATAAISLSPATTFQIDGGATYNHNVNNSAVWDGIEIISTTSNVRYGLAGPQEVAALSYGNLYVSGGNTKTLAGDVTVEGSLDLIDGNISLGSAAWNLTLGTQASVTSSGGFGNTRMVVCDGSGSLIKQGLTPADFSIIYPVGTGSYYTPFEITALSATAAGTGSIGVRAVAETAPGPPSAAGADLTKYWSITTSNISVTSADIRMTYMNPEEVGPGGDQSRYVPFLYSSGAWSQPGLFSAAGVNPMTVTGLSDIDGQWTARTEPAYNYFYSYQSGNWHDPETWTTDPSGTLQTGNGIPDEGAIVVILTDRTVTLTEDVTETGLAVTVTPGAFLDQSVYSFTGTLSSLSGRGTLMLASVNFPVATINTLVNEGGGTTEYYNTSDFTLPAAQGIYNNLIINTSGATTTQLSSLTLNGNLLVRSGTFRINDNISSAKLSLTVAGDVTVEAGAAIAVGNGVTNTSIGGTGGSAPYLNYYLNFHTVKIRGNFTNEGTVRFTNLNHPLYNAFPPTAAGATSGAASVYFEGASDNTLTCNGVTDFYNLIINKGIDQTYSLTVNSSSWSHFRLFGANSLDAESVTGNPALRKALWIYAGTLFLKGNVIIPSLSEGTTASAHYYIPASGALVSDGVDVAVFVTADDYREVNTAYGVSASSNAVTGVDVTGTGSAMYVFGRLQVNNGYLSAKESGGIVTSSTASGQVIINGGVTDTKQLLFSSGSASYSQSGGLLILRGRFRRTPVAYSTIVNLTDVSVSTLNTARTTSGTSTAFGTFNQENSSNILNLSGGTIRIYDVTGTVANEAFDVKASAANINVTGGTLEIIPSTGTIQPDATYYAIHSTAPLWNVMINRSSGTASARMSTSLTVLNDMSIMSGVLDANSNDLTIGGNFMIESGTTYTSGSNTTMMNGKEARMLAVNTVTPLSFNRFSVEKPAGVAVTLSGSQEIINISSGFSLVAGNLILGGKTLNISGSLFNSGVVSGTGKLTVNGSAAQTIAGAGTFGNLELANTAVAPVSLLDHMTVNGTLAFTVDRLLNIGTYNLHLNDTAIITGAGPGRFVQTAGNSGDGGLSRSYNAAESFVFPVGVAGKYTPATIGFTESPATYGSVTVIPVDYEHPVTTVKGQSLSYFWRVRSAGFSGIPVYSVTHSFIYNESDAAGTDLNYVPALYDAVSKAWYAGLATDIDRTGNIISDWNSPTNSSNFLDADYTAGTAASFGTPGIYYSRQSGLWSSNSTWSLTGHTVNNPPSAPPGANDIVIIGGNDSIWLATETPALPVNNTDPSVTYYQLNKAAVNCATLQIETGSVLDIQNNPGSTFASVLTHPGGNGKLRLTTRDPSSDFDLPEAFVYPGGDFSEFSVNQGISEFYSINPESGTYYILPSNASEYGTVIMTPLRGSNIIMPNIPVVTINGDLICNGSDADAWLAMTWTGIYGTIVEKTVNIKRNLIVAGGSFEFIYNGTRLQRLNIDGDVYVAPGAGIDVWSSSTNNIISIGGSVYNNSNNALAGSSRSQIRLRNGTNVCNVIFTGNRSAVLTNNPALSTTPVTIFNNVTIDKGNSPDTTLTWNIAGTLTTQNNNWLTLVNGTLVYDRAGTFNISTTTDFTIPSTAGLTLNTPSDVFISNNPGSEILYLNGRLRITGGGGNVFIGPSGNTVNNADIEYSGSGASLLEIQNGNLFVNGQIRRPLASTNGTLTYRQSGGNVFIFGNNASAAKAKLEVLNDGSEFTMTGGTLTIVRGGGTTFGDLYLRPATSSITGGTVIFTQVPAAGPVIDANQSYQLDANVPLSNLEVNGKTTGTTRTAELSLMISPLVLNGSLTISNNLSSFSSGNRNVTIKGNLNNNGIYNYGTNQTIFDGGVQSITGTSVTNFYDLEVSSLTSLTANGNLTVNRDLNIVSGNLVLGNNQLTLLGNLNNNGAYTDNNLTGGISLAGSTQQTISGTGSFARLVLDNTAGARLNNDVAVQHDLVLTNGELDINKYQLTLSQNSLIQGTGFNTGKMIRSDGVASSRGLLKFFPAGAQTFTFPVGVAGKYTPALFTVTASTAVGSVRINPVNDFHPSIIDPLNSLGYYWQAESSGISGLNASLVFSYLTADVSGNEAAYVAARLVQPGGTWDKATPGAATDNVNETANTVAFYYTGGNNLNGDYTAGTDAAIPPEVPEYITNSNGNWSDPSIWTPVGSSPPCPAGGPRGSNVIIDHVVTADVNFISVLNAVINNELRLVAPTFGHNLGNVAGDGKIYLEGGNMPGGTFNEFTDCSGNGTIEYGGSGSYTIVSGVYTSVPNLIFSGTGTRILPNADLTVCKRLVIDGPLLDNSVNNRKLTLQGSFERYNSGSFKSGTGTYPAATVSFSGSAVQSLGGATGNFTGSNRFWNIEINNTAGLTLNDGADIEVGNQLMLTNGVVSVPPTGRLIILSTSQTAVVPAGGSATSWVSGPLTKQIINGESFLYPLGRGVIKGHRFTLVSTAGTTASFTAEYFSPNNTATSIAPPLDVTNTLEYWSVSSSSPASARVRIGWDPQSDLTPLVTANGLADMRVAGYSTSMWRELASTASGNNNNGEVETTGSVSTGSTPSDFTTASISGTLARASFSSFAPICGSGGIPVSFISFSPISLNYILSYTIDGIVQPDVTVTSLPYSLPATVSGVYRLTGFRFNGGTGTGVVDANTVTVYQLPTPSNAGTNQSLCGLSTTTLEGNDPGPYSGLWTVVSGAGG
ncbi:MAG: GEVED domain-containing protein, partial [Bacteroidales bacterium]|nr:GEVED domain-containing protein [Bacteroidales bacterium]